MNQKSRLLTIGQFASLHGINKKTLMWYDEIGLFKPASINPENGYRFYSYHQSSLLETILLLRELDVSINEIQGFIKDRSAKSLKCLLDERIAELDIKLDHLRAVRETLCNYRQNMETLSAMDLSKICLVQKKERCLVTVDIDRETSYDQGVERILAKTQEYELRHLHDASYGTMIPVRCLYQRDFDSYSNLFMEIPLPSSCIQSSREASSSPAHRAEARCAAVPRVQKTGLHIQPCGTYLQAFYQGDWNKMPAKYEKILAYAKSCGLSLTGFSYEKIINETVTDRMEDYIVQIEIPASK
ncbi:MAG: MerR family transcriptional regulator [Lachnospiraceae bacterium]|nr:MerR family transcriptional regulator [Lachnospiraceae bacterium]